MQDFGKIDPDGIPCIIDSKDRNKAGKTLPACGLYLVNVYYSKEELDKQLLMNQTKDEKRDIVYMENFIRRESK